MVPVPQGIASQQEKGLFFGVCPGLNSRPRTCQTGTFATELNLRLKNWTVSIWAPIFYAWSLVGECVKHETMWNHGILRGCVAEFCPLKGHCVGATGPNTFKNQDDDKKGLKLVARSSFLKEVSNVGFYKAS